MIHNEMIISIVCISLMYVKSLFHNIEKEHAYKHALSQER
ncbi:hypothetical protein bthur0011_20340 [Bacillus thuringiensis serovar huazhongensis BGSC 4BD1]|nr:hypothetical protein bthur0004_21280 [Bacillus thuringiensis serovar sotto str. T04001]EEM83876.1 hypothetical protein bthur0011_20340 [Bacillus thuringiensis serovar huazhongensis BGSC 4BD1]KLA25812.1 hypothetical protein B4080_2452 [Bacillus cereus]